MLRKSFFFYIVFLLISYSVFSQKQRTEKPKREKKTKPAKTNAIYLHVPVPYLKFVYRDVVTGKHIDYVPTPKYNLGIGIKLGGFNFLIGTGLAVYKQDLAAKGSSKYRDITIQINGKSFTHDFCYQGFKGFYIKNSADYGVYPASNPYLIRPDLRLTLIGFNSLYILNSERFSFKNTFGFNRADTKNGGSFLIGIYYYYLNQNGDSGIVSTEFKPYLSPESYIRLSAEQTYGLNVGYGFNLIIAKRLHFTLALIEGVGFYDIKYTLEDYRKYASPSAMATKTNLRVNLGYDLGKLFIGGTCNFDYYYFKKMTYSVIDFSNAKFRFFLGMKLGKQKKGD